MGSLLSLVGIDTDLEHESTRLYRQGYRNHLIDIPPCVSVAWVGKTCQISPITSHTSACRHKVYFCDNHQKIILWGVFSKREIAFLIRRHSPRIRFEWKQPQPLHGIVPRLTIQQSVHEHVVGI